MASSISKHIQHRVVNGALRSVQLGMKVMPRRAVKLFMNSVFPLVCLATKGLNRICARNLEQVYGEAEDKKKYKLMAKRYIRSIGEAMMDMLYYIDRPEELAKIVSIEHEDRLKEALAQGRGVIAVSAHFGNFPLMFISLVQKGYKVNVIIRNMRDENFSKFMRQQCDKWGIRMICTTPAKQFLKESLGALKRNEMLFFLADEFARKEGGVKVQFFNREVLRPTGPILFFDRTAAPILPIFVVQDEHKDFKIFVEKPFKVSHGRNEQESLAKNVSALSRIMERFIHRYPFQWGGWFNKRWTLGL